MLMLEGIFELVSAYKRSHKPKVVRAARRSKSPVRAQAAQSRPQTENRQFKA